MGKIKRNLIRSLRLVEYAFLGAIVLHLGTQVNYCAHTIADMASPSKERKEFREEFGFPIRGWKNDIEEKPVNLSIVGEVIQREKIVQPFDLVSLRIRPDDYFKKSFWEQMDQLFTEGEFGYYRLDNIVLDACYSNSTVHHEIKHAKADEIIKGYPEFMQKWEDLARDEAGNSLYLDAIAWFERPDYYNLDYNESVRLGFASNYARTNVDEDIATLCERAETYPHFFEKWLGDGEGRNQKIIEKVRLAQEVKLIPPDFSEYIMLRRILREVYGDSIYIKDRKKAEEFLEQSQRFLEDHPKTIYQSELRKERGKILRKDDDWQEAILEYNLVLSCHFKDSDAYLDALEDLAFCYSLLGDAEKSVVYYDAKKEYQARFNGGDIRLTTRGVNDFLEERLRSLDK